MRLFAFADEASPSLDRQIAALQRNGLEGLEIRGVDGVNICDISLEQAAHIRKKLDAAQLSVWSIGSPIGKIPLEAEFEPHLEKFRHTLKLAQILGAENIRIFSFYVPQYCNIQPFVGEVLNRMQAFMDAAEGTGITLCHENVKGIFGSSPNHCELLAQMVPGLKLVYDPANFLQSGHHALDAWEIVRPYVKYLHIKDALPTGRVVPAGQGWAHLDEILPDFFRRGGQVLSVEPHLQVFDGMQALGQPGDAQTVGSAYPDGDTAFDAACDALKGLLKGIGLQNHPI